MYLVRIHSIGLIKIAKIYPISLRRKSYAAAYTHDLANSIFNIETIRYIFAA
jgi:hypothetical protein